MVSFSGGKTNGNYLKAITSKRYKRNQRYYKYSIQIYVNYSRQIKNHFTL